MASNAIELKPREVVSNKCCEFVYEVSKGKIPESFTIVGNSKYDIVEISVVGSGKHIMTTTRELFELRQKFNGSRNMRGFQDDGHIPFDYENCRVYMPAAISDSYMHEIFKNKKVIIKVTYVGNVTEISKPLIIVREIDL